MTRSGGAHDLIERLRREETSAVEAMRFCLRRIGEREQEVRAFAYLVPEAAIAAAEQADAARASGLGPGPLHGLPVAVKDIIDTADMPTEFGGEIFVGRQPQRDATIVSRLRSAGAIVIGKAVTSQYGLFIPGPTRNPHELARTPGGSSSGSAAAVAAGFVPVALGTQTNGSIIRPASYCGVLGFKPSLGLLPRTGVLRHAPLVDHPGVFARTVADAAMVVDAIGGEDAEDALSRPLPGSLLAAYLEHA
jgi:Asp-tRNA(Asn)/Glu-tRNA(Gln) amidotransferase A subunit family amidase